LQPRSMAGTLKILGGRIHCGDFSPRPSGDAV